MTKNKLSDLNDHLFTQLERLCEEDLTVEDIEREVKRADAIVAVSDKVISNADLQLRAAKLMAEHGPHIERFLPSINNKQTIQRPQIDAKTD